VSHETPQSGGASSRPHDAVARLPSLEAAMNRCDWCGNLLSTCRCVYKVQGEERYYCSQSCFLQGEERRLRYRAALAGTVHAHWTATLVSIAVLAFILSGGTSALAHDPRTHQVDELANARSKAGGLCCDGKDYTIPYSWERTERGYRIHFGGRWVDIPKDAEVNNMRNPDGEAKAWLAFDEQGEPYVRCFMPGMEG
jgi:hypothetical protein